MVLRQGMTLVGIGSGIGLVMAATASRLFTSLQGGAPGLDAASYLAVLALFALVGLLACWVPVRRAYRIRTIDALRYE
jgi:putative ABC transport system permease protein